MTKNGYKILMSTNPTKVTLNVCRKFSLDYFGRRIANRGSYFENDSNTFEDI